MYWSSEGTGGSLLLLPASTRIEFDLVIYCMFCPCSGFIYLLIFFCGLTLEKLFEFISVHPLI